ncbi:transposase [Streptomyces sp. NPDC049541]|uniref:transposase n=1 Tax=Streptomyces sp. NPDC049541 TaxID=3365594 RepID=UPI0037B9C569
MIDAIVIKIQDGAVASWPVYVAIGINLQGERDVLVPWLDLPVDLTAEFEADLADIRRLVTAAAQRQG